MKTSLRVIFFLFLLTSCVGISAVSAQSGSGDKSFSGINWDDEKPEKSNSFSGRNWDDDAKPATSSKSGINWDEDESEQSAEKKNDNTSVNRSESGVQKGIAESESSNRLISREWFIHITGFFLFAIYLIGGVFTAYITRHRAIAVTFPPELLILMHSVWPLELLLFPIFGKKAK